MNFVVKFETSNCNYLVEMHPGLMIVLKSSIEVQSELANLHLSMKLLKSLEKNHLGEKTE